MTAWERVGWCAAVGCLLGAVAFRPTLRAVRPDVAVISCALEDCYEWLVPRRTEFDPWQKRWCEKDVSPRVIRLSSAGPDRIPGTRDDVDVGEACEALDLRPGRTAPMWVHVACRGPELLTLAAITLAWCLIVPFRRSPRATLARELARAALLGSVPAASGALALDWYLRTSWWWQELDRANVLLVPWRVAACGSVVLFCGLAALAYRLRSPTTAGTPTTSPGSSPGPRTP